MNISKRELSSLIDSLRDFPKFFDKASKCSQSSLPQIKIEIGSINSKDNPFAQYCTVIPEHLKRHFSLSLRFGNNNSSDFIITKIEIHAINFFPKKFSILTITEVTTSTRTDITFQKTAKQLRAITKCSTFIPDSRYNNCIIKLIGNVPCPKKMCSDILCVHKKTFQFLEKKTNIVFNAGLHVRPAIFSLKYKQNCFSWSFVKRFFEETNNSIQDIFGDVYCTACPNERCVNFSSNSTFSIYDNNRCKACSQVPNNLFRDRKPTIMLFGVDCTHCFGKKRFVTTEKKSHL